MELGMHYLFSYGTLLLEKVQLENYGRILTGRQDRLLGYTLDNVEVADEAVLQKSEQVLHPIAVKTGNAIDFVDGMMFEMSAEELEETDRYEVADYIRVKETLTSGQEAWVYIRRNQHD